MSANAQMPPTPRQNTRAKIVETERETKLFRTNRSIAVRLPPDFGSAGDAVRIVRDGERLIIEPILKAKELATLLTEWANQPPLEDKDLLPENLNASLIPLRDIDL